jgi:hypothetical protein
MVIKASGISESLDAAVVSRKKGRPEAAEG